MSHNLVQLRRNRGDLGVQDNALQRLKHVMHERRVITTDDVAAVARATGQPEASVFGVATYYGDLGTKPRGRTRVKVCKGTACSRGVRRRVRRLDGGGARPRRWARRAPTARSRSRRVYCLGFCNAGPTVEVEGRIYGELTPERAKALAKELEERRRARRGARRARAALRGARRPGDRPRAPRAPDRRDRTSTSRARTAPSRASRRRSRR